MDGSILLIFALDFLYTTAIAIGASWLFTSRYLVRRSQDHLGKGDVETLRSMRDELKMLLMLDDQGIWLMPEKNRARVRGLVETHDKRKELPA